MFKQQTWKVKCPRCKRKWSFKSDKLLQGPKYKYCRNCLKIERDTGRAVFRGSMGHFPSGRQLDQEEI